MVNYKNFRSLPVFNLVSLQVCIKVQGNKRFKLEHWRILKKLKWYIAIAIIAVMLISIFAFLSEKSFIPPNLISEKTDDPTSSQQELAPEHQEPTEPSITDSLISIDPPFLQIFREAPGLIKSAPTINSTVWMKVAANAWAYYTPGFGVDPDTGLPYSSSLHYAYFTDWDLGAYIQAIINAQKIGLIDLNGTWGSFDRINKVLTFLENRPLNPYGYPFQFYDAKTGIEFHPPLFDPNEICNIVDTGKLFVALNNLRTLNNAFAPRINTIVLNGRSNYTALVANILTYVNSRSTYIYYISSGFASFWPQQLEAVPSTILSNILNSENLTSYGVSLPIAKICNEPLLSSFFELDNGDSLRLMGLVNQVYLACKAYYDATGKYIAPSEGYNGTTWVYEWVVAPNGEPWRVTDFWFHPLENARPVVRYKVAFSFLALFNTTFARNMVVWLEDALYEPMNGYPDGVDSQGVRYERLSSIANTLILDAARYALHKEA
jgi:hypothetical protein